MQDDPICLSSEEEPESHTTTRRNQSQEGPANDENVPAGMDEAAPDSPVQVGVASGRLPVISHEVALLWQLHMTLNPSSSLQRPYLTLDLP